MSVHNNTRHVKQQPVKGSSECYFQCFRFNQQDLTKVFCYLPLSITDSDQHYVRFWGSNPEVHGGQQVNLPGWLRGQSGAVDRVSSVAGGGSRLGSGLASGTATLHLQSVSALIGSSHLPLVDNSGLKGLESCLK